MYMVWCEPVLLRNPCISSLVGELDLPFLLSGNEELGKYCCCLTARPLLSLPAIDGYI